MIGVAGVCWPQMIYDFFDYMGARGDRQTTILALALFAPHSIEFVVTLHQRLRYFSISKNSKLNVYYLFGGFNSFGTASFGDEPKACHLARPFENWKLN